MKLLKTIVLLFFLLAVCEPGLFAQFQNKIFDGRNTDPFCINYQQMLNTRPKEVLFGIAINSDGDVYFEINNEEWFRKLFPPGTGVMADIVARDQYSCTNYQSPKGVFKGLALAPVYVENFKANRKEMIPGYVTIKIGKVPPELLKKDIEASLVIIYYNKVCFYTNFLDIDRSAWDLLPMGLYTDTLLKVNGRMDTVVGKAFTYEEKVQVVVPFARNKDSYEGKDVQRIYDSLQLKNCVIKKVSIRAYSSVEGTEAANQQLMKGRANTMVSLMKKIQPDLKRIDIMAAENWLDFYQDVKSTGFDYLSHMSRGQVKVKLLDRRIADSLETILSKERMVLLTIYYGQRSGVEGVKNDSILGAFSRVVAEKNIQQARVIQKEIFERISNNILPDDYLDRLEVPQEKGFLELLNDRVIYKYTLHLSTGQAALLAFKAIRDLDPENGKINYNICALTLFEWQFREDSIDINRLLGDINQLERQGIHGSLVKRMLVNYHVLLSFDLLNKYRYDEKDKSVLFIKNNYEHLLLTDEDRFALAKYFSFYSESSWAEEMISDRIDQLDVSEDLLFYYVNLGFFKPGEYADERFKKALLNASTMNRRRFCRFFGPSDKGGAGLQLLDVDLFRQLYCENCVSQKL